MRVTRCTTPTISVKSISIISLLARACQKRVGSETGMTLTELIIATAVASVVLLGSVAVFEINQRALPGFEARTSLKTANERILGTMGIRLTECKRLFQNTAADRGYLLKLALSSATATGDTRLPTIEVNGSLATATTSFVSASVGNSLFFARVETPRDYTVLNAAGASGSVRVDTYRFMYYYMTPDSSTTIGGTVRRVLREAQSNSYVDYAQLTSLTDTTKRANTIAAAYADNLRFAWDSASTVSTGAFFSMSAGGALTSVPSHQIAMTGDEMEKIASGITIGGYRYGVSPNTSASFNTGVTVPALGTASGNFPGGFEIAIVGPTGSRKVFIRLALAATGSFKGSLADLSTALYSARDLW